MIIDESKLSGDRAKHFLAGVLEEHDPTPDELILLDELARAIDESDMLRAAVNEYGAITRGSKGQPVVNPAIAALASNRKSIESLCKRLDLSVDPDEKDSPRTVAAREAANERWRQEADRRRRRAA